MRILVTGHNGYIGAVMVPMLVAEGHDVVGLDSDLFAECTFGNGVYPIPELIRLSHSVEVIFRGKRVT